jgi:predicted AAA+ superfamily ATPase
VDVGLLNALVGATWNQFKNPAGAMNIRDGAVAEQFVGQELISTLGRGKQELNYWLRDGKTTNAEVDYVAAVGDVLLPVEVKAGKSGTLRSLRTFCEGKRPKVAFRFDTQLPSIQQIPFDSVAARPNERDLTWDLISLPLYACSQLARIFQKHSN